MSLLRLGAVLLLIGPSAFMSGGEALLGCFSRSSRITLVVKPSGAPLVKFLQAAP
jgi:hypothetical protein